MRGQRVQAALGAPGQVAAQVRFGVLTGGALEAGQVGGHCQPQPVGERLRRIGGRGDQRGEGLHSLTLQRPAVTVNLASTNLAANASRRSRTRWSEVCACSLWTVGFSPS